MLTAVIVIAAAAMIATTLATRAAIQYLKTRDIVDRPTKRSSHLESTLRGGGLAIVSVILISWAVIDWGPAILGVRDPVPGMAWIIAATVAIAVTSWLDDLWGLSPFIRLAAHAVAIAAILSLVPLPGRIFQGLLPPTVELVLAGLIWLWFVNLFNFMDGIDGISGIETVTIGLGIVTVSLVADIEETLLLLSVAVTATMLTFLKWNWHPAKIFLGDVGSVPLGFLLGWLLLNLAALGQWAAAMILPAYYFSDATITLARRALRGEKVWLAHRQHYYQRAVASGLGHAAVSLRIAYTGAALIALAGISAAGWPVAGLASAAGVVVVLLFNLSRSTR